MKTKLKSKKWKSLVSGTRGREFESRRPDQI